MFKYLVAAALVLPAVIIYLLAWFICQEGNPANWHPLGRLLYCFFSLVATGFVLTGVVEVCKDS